MEFILPPEIYRSKNGKYPYLQNLFYSDFPTKIIVDKKPNGTVIHLDDEVVHGFLLQEQAMDMAANGTTDVPGFWGLIKEVITQSATSITQGCYIKDIATWIEIDDKTKLTPSFMPNSLKEDDTQMTWEECAASISSTITESIISPTKYIIKANPESRFLKMDELNSLIQYCENDADITLLNKFEVKQLLASTDYSEAT